MVYSFIGGIKMKKIFAHGVLSLFIMICVLCDTISLNAITIKKDSGVDEKTNIFVNLVTGEKICYDDEECVYVAENIINKVELIDNEVIISESEYYQFVSEVENSRSTTPIGISPSAQANMPYSMICHLKIHYNETNQLGYGTGFFVGPKAIATAAHIIYNPDPNFTVKSIDVCYSYKTSSGNRYAYSQVSATYFRNYKLYSGTAAHAERFKAVFPDLSS